ncbi:ImmA/IrrE family metallo-endopeptidase [Azoarcus communis]|jgi:Predicted Zn peptidase|uniref:ImmA/IrrE family metallo-endopeptidase n=1 Tax=Parazoarcus communis TaxID=41977 RepID=UPI0014598BCA|nr:ImmA/IrrE family metallo-endopeptidase [Parazoarcus communis]NMG50031.1 ImmA/IrrE family metallo-endopeptidase [Parazoarcus communis]
MTEPTTPAGWGIQLSKLWIASGQPFPVDVKLLALEVTKQRFEDPVGLVVPHGVSGIDGMLSKRAKKGDWCISYDESVTVPGRINFTLAHELGHYFCHRQRQAEFRCGQGAMLDYYGDASRKLEKEANVFASYLLMPATDFRQQIDGQTISLELLGAVADRYETSFTATALKWLEITPEAAMLVVARDEFICWSYPSRQASSKRAYLPPGTEVPATAIERLQTATNHSGNNWCSVPPGVWHPSLEAEEAVIVSDQFELTIFLVRFPSVREVVHEEETEHDSFDVLAGLAQGFDWGR